ncbi:hypothetical protein EDB85DRAFT_247695 [Lactarius pseudohatsudake]|nr:hypothetical protein EDB85DRAFT_247695 [Lactarius pseudohatsudake]
MSLATFLFVLSTCQQRDLQCLLSLLQSSLCSYFPLVVYSFHLNNPLLYFKLTLCKVRDGFLVGVEIRRRSLGVVNQ